ncbi:MAG: LCP family protein, partial [bacterium]|nr:LCP family protein [bacterium]
MKRRIDVDKLGLLRRKKRRRRILLIAALSVLLLSGAFFAVSRTGFFRALLTPISFVARLVNPVELKEEEGRLNVLILGLDTRGGTGLMNTDTILVGSISTLEGDPALISIPRDFWMNLSPYGSGRINSAYSRGGTQKDGSFDEEKGVAFAASKIEEVLGIKIPYWVVVDFEGFEQIIKTLGGIEVCVEKAFDDYSYPVPGREAAYPISSRYERLHFDAGCQKMDGTTALKYARSRMGNNDEGNDFARARRQQNVILGVKNKIFSLDL